jgi:DNA invertase Pin-like site-specific DNA recombinase
MKGASMSDTVRAAIYCRLSRRGGRSVERQEQDGRRIAAERGWEVAAVYRETASASEYGKRGYRDKGTGPRRRWRALLAAVERGEYDALILWMEDRSSRDTLDAAAFVKACQANGLTRIVLPSHDYDLSDREQAHRFVGEVHAAELEVIKVSKRIRRARQQEAEEGLPVPGGKRGFGDPGGRRVRDPEKSDDDPDKWLRDERGRWLRTGTIPDEQLHAERELIRQAARRLRAGDSLRGIVTDWNARRIPAAGGERWTTRSLKRLLLQPRLAGLRNYNGTLIELRDMDAILDRERWQEVVAILTDPARSESARSPLVTGKGGVARHLLAGMVFCGVCGAKLRVTKHVGLRVYRCPPRADGGHRCVQRDADRLERLIERTLFKAVESPKWGELAAERPGQEDPSRELYERLARDQALLDRADDAVTVAELEGDRRKVNSLARVRADIEARMERTRAAINRRTDTRVVAEVPRNLREVWPGLSLDRKRAILATVLRLPADAGKGIVVHPQGTGRHVFDPATIKADWRA